MQILQAVKELPHGFIHSSVGKDQDIGSVSVCTIRLNKQTIYGFLKTCILIINNRNVSTLNPSTFILLIFIRSVFVRIGLLILSTLQFSGFSSKRFPSVPIYRRRCYNLLTDGIDWRVGYLCKQLLKIIKQRLTVSGQHRKRCICTHRSGSFNAVLCHRQDGIL